MGVKVFANRAKFLISCAPFLKTVFVVLTLFLVSCVSFNYVN